MMTLRSSNHLVPLPGRCVGVETSLRLQLFVYTIQTLPIVGRVDLAAVFFDAARWQQENLFFSK
jgi:hypothetical protein